MINTFPVLFGSLKELFDAMKCLAREKKHEIWSEKLINKKSKQLQYNEETVNEWITRRTFCKSLNLEKEYRHNYCPGLSDGNPGSSLSALPPSNNPGENHSSIRLTLASNCDTKSVERRVSQAIKPHATPKMGEGKDSPWCNFSFDIREKKRGDGLLVRRSQVWNQIICLVDVNTPP